MGLNIMLPFEQDANPVIAGDAKLVHMKYFFTRKLMFVKECDGVCLLPGGFGTLDEGLEVLTLLQTGKRDLVPVVFLDVPGGSFWQDWHDFVQRRLLGQHMISPDDLSLYKLTDNVADGGRRSDAVLTASTTACVTCATNWCCGCKRRRTNRCWPRSTPNSATC